MDSVRESRATGTNQSSGWKSDDFGKLPSPSLSSGSRATSSRWRLPHLGHDSDDGQLRNEVAPPTCALYLFRATFCSASSQREIYYVSFAVDTIFPPVFGKIQSRRRAHFFANETIQRKRNNFRCSMFDSWESGTVLSLKSDATAKFVYAIANVFLHDCINAVFQVENYSGWDDVSGREKSTGREREREPSDREGKISERAKSRLIRVN